MLPSLNLGFISLQLYPFFWGFAWATGSWYVHQNMPKELKSKNILNLIGLFFVSVLGAKYIFDLSGGSYTFSSGLGFVFYGGLLAAGLYLLLLYVTKNKWVRVAAKPMIIILPLCHAIGRLGCFFAGCCFGLPLEHNFYGLDHIPIPLIEALFLVFLFYYQLKAKEKPTLYLVAQYFTLYGILRLALEIFRGDARGHWMVLPPSVWISMGLIYLGFFFFSSSYSRKQSRI